MDKRKTSTHLILFATVTAAVTLLALPMAQANVGDPSKRGLPEGMKASRKKFADDEILVVYRAGTSLVEAAQHREAIRANFVGNFNTRKGTVHRLRVQKDTLEGTLRDLQADPQILHAQRNFKYYAQAVPNDTMYGQQWAFKNTGQTIFGSSTFNEVPRSQNNPGTSGKDMGLEAAWDRITDCSSTIVAVVDTGINFNHEDLASNMWNGGSSFPNHGWNVLNNNNNPMDYNGHGTHVAGTVGAAGNNSKGGSGVCWKAKIMAVRALDASGTGTTEHVAKGIEWAADHGARVINLSLGTSEEDPILRDAISHAATLGAVIVVAAGNDATNNDDAQHANFPCNQSSPNLLCVAALDQAYSLASFSNYGATSVHVGAPGVNIVSPWAGETMTLNDSFNTSGSINWTRNNTSWKYGKKNIDYDGQTYSVDAIFDPSNYNGSSAKYANNANDKVYKTFDFSTWSSASIAIYAFIDLEQGFDLLRVGSRIGAGDPFGTGGSNLDSLTGSGGADFTDLSYDLTGCGGQSCTVGFQLSSDEMNTASGVELFGFQASGIKLDNLHYEIQAGTSMAAPHVAGLAAMIASFNPAYTGTDIVESIKNGGVATASLAGKTATGKAASAIGSLSYISAPKGVSVTLQ